MNISDLHVHTNYCDGKNSPEEMVQAAASLGYKKIGLVCHSFVDFDDCCASIEGQEKFVKEVHLLKEKYSEKIEVLAGVEQDYFSEIDNSIFDYVIGSVHYVKKDNEYLSVDLDKETFLDNINIHFDNNPYLFVQEYYKLVAQVKDKTNADIIGHFDLITKFNQGDCIFDTQNKAYTNAWKTALDELGCAQTTFEINYGAVVSGLKNEPYPSSDIVDYIKNQCGSFIKSSDSHSIEALKKSFTYISQ